MVDQTNYNGTRNVQDVPYRTGAVQPVHHYSAERIAKLRENRTARQEERARLEEEVRFIDSICM